MKVAVVYHSESGNTRRMAELIVEGAEGAEGVEGVQAKMMGVDEVDTDFLTQAPVLILGCPTYEGTCSWQMKMFLDTAPVSFVGKLGGVFASQNWPGGGGADLTEITLIAGMLVHSMLVYSGGTAQGSPYLHFGAVSTRSPEGLYEERCRKLGQNLAAKGLELFGQ
ncbi:MAG: flavodoxin domain-containing protein [Candidatus Brocadiia bacterium]|nr:flavodoxin domain-containing protein [Candidatus Brocadiia bacterium]